MPGREPSERGAVRTTARPRVRAVLQVMMATSLVVGGLAALARTRERIGIVVDHGEPEPDQRKRPVLPAVGCGVCERDKLRCRRRAWSILFGIALRRSRWPSIGTGSGR